MQEREVRLLVEKGHFNKALVVTDPAGSGWNVRLQNHTREDRGYPVRQARRGPGIQDFRCRHRLVS
jgi:hypothetical protein